MASDSASLLHERIREAVAGQGRELVVLAGSALTMPDRELDRRLAALA